VGEGVGVRGEVGRWGESRVTRQEGIGHWGWASREEERCLDEKLSSHEMRVGG
jgi:hypothetical protein